MVENFSGFFENFTLQDSLHNETSPFLYSVLILDPLIGFPLIGQIVSLSSSASETDNTVKNEIVYENSFVISISKYPYFEDSFDIFNCTRSMSISFC